MVRDLLLRVLVGELSKYGRDSSGNFVISPASLEEVSNKVTESVSKAVERPIVTVNEPQIFALAQKAGFQIVPVTVGGVPKMDIRDPSGTIGLNEHVSRLVDSTLGFAMESVNARMKVPS